ncbi:bifunctional diaminohydroxyphosphoribosylaminopyrimidine deaminase/5-amino-6-(5-phosphoribosylamino)uracil reductase RibD [Neorhizobium sp. NPDC001467]|uniref:bifunctional diaminohydroxyphosphoribosylaminopyrimidine deaminase/5-amino-6-(5-phosphoribosylamino)uracil reductase RibD n=1 Tax=Neorhizobium sp. NPDC001467 TaxID=3390595 RepID=UPI003D016068
MVPKSTPEDDRRFMRQAIELSRTHTGLTGSNPSVGCVIVKDGAVVGAAVTAVGGRPHAETQAIAMAGDSARGATAYVTLEPCAHFGRTPPCANALVDAAVARVVVAVIDPDPRVAGQGVKILVDAGVAVETGLLQDEARRPLAGYLMRKLRGRPFVTLKLAVSADGMLGRRGEEIAITGEAVRTEVHRLRAEHDAVLVGIGTVLADDPDLTVRIPGLEHRSPLRIVLDRNGRFAETSRLAQTAARAPVIVASTGGTPDGAKDAAIPPASCSCRQQDHAGETNRLTAPITRLSADGLGTLLQTLAGMGISSLLVEGGATVAAAFLAEGLIDRIVLYVGDRVIGNGGLESPLTPSDMPASFTFLGTAAVGADRRHDYERSA